MTIEQTSFRMVSMDPNHFWISGVEMTSVGNSFSVDAGGFGFIGKDCSVGVGGGLRRNNWLRPNGLDPGLDITNTRTLFVYKNMFSTSCTIKKLIGTYKSHTTHFTNVTDAANNYNKISFNN